MCEARLKLLYQALITNRMGENQQWHDDYVAFVGEVNDVRIAPNDRTLEEDFLTKLLFQNKNGISSRGQSILSNKTFDAFIQDQDFLAALSEFIKFSAPSKENFETFKEAWDTARKQANEANNTKQPNTPLLVNRVAAACTLSVSSTVDEGKFNNVAGWLIENGLITDFTEEQNQNWFSKNQHVMKQLTEKLQAETTDPIWISMFVWELYNYVVNPFSLKKQVIKYGAPGTGKTYMAKKETKILFELWKAEYDAESLFTAESQIKLMQFHPSISYEDFMEGLRPSLGENGQTQLTLQNGVFKSFCVEAGKWEKDVSKLGLLNISWEDLTIENLSEHKEQLLKGGHWNHIFTEENTNKKLTDCVPPFFFIIDEINRAELSRVLGELMYCLEYRGVEGAIDTQYASLNTKDTAMLGEKEGEYKFFIPHNLYLIGTMNTIDRSIESFDFALRRRFRWEEVAPDMGILALHLRESDEGKAETKKWEGLAKNLEELNTAISEEPLLGSDYQIGHAYLMNLKYPPNLTLKQVKQQIWQDSLLPLLQEYLRGTGSEDAKIKGFEKAFGISS